MSETSIRLSVLLRANIAAVTTTLCLDSRGTYLNFKCSNRCCDSLGTATQALEAITDLRRKIWVDPKVYAGTPGLTQSVIKHLMTMEGKEYRNCLLLQMVMSLVIEDRSIDPSTGIITVNRHIKFVLGINNIYLTTYLLYINIYLL